MLDPGVTTQERPSDDAGPEEAIAGASVPAGASEDAAPPPQGFVWPVTELTALEAFAGLLVGFSLLATTNAVAIAAGAAWPRGGLGVRLAHHLFDATEVFGVGALAGVLVALWIRYVRLPAWVSATAYGGLASAAMFVSVGQDLRRQALVATKGHLEIPGLVVLVALCGFAIPAAHLIGATFSRTHRLRAIPLVASLGGVVTNYLVVRDDYPAMHGAIAWTAATLAGATLAPPVAAQLQRWVARWGRPRALAPIALVAGFGLLVPPSNAVRIVLFREPGCMASWILASAYWRLPSLPADVVAPASPWYADRSNLPPVPPTTPPLLAKPPVVVMITIDATRADDIADPAHDAMFPTFAALKKSGAFFSDATSPGGQTAVSLTTTFSGRYFSELYWTMHGTAETRFTYAADDPAVRFPELLSARGVATGSLCGVNFLAAEFGVLRGFRDERVIARGRSHAFARDLIDPLLDRLRRAGRGPLFLYAHLMEPHAPYDRGALKTGPDHDRYLSEIAVVDQQLARVVEVLDQRFRDRAILIVSADHGEAFGEHATREHTKTLYEELLHVPLLIRGAGIAPRRIDEHVGLIDVGPTLLDVFGVPTPPTYEGQSLVPLLAGRPSGLDRALGAEGRLRQVLYFGRALKVIEDPRRKIIEAYDLERDPGELDNVYDRDPRSVFPAIAALRAFFAAHALHRPGYSPVYKP